MYWRGDGGAWQEAGQEVEPDQTELQLEVQPGLIQAGVVVVTENGTPFPRVESEEIIVEMYEEEQTEEEIYEEDQAGDEEYEGEEETDSDVRSIADILMLGENDGNDEEQTDNYEENDVEYDEEDDGDIDDEKEEGDSVEDTNLVPAEVQYVVPCNETEFKVDCTM